MTISDLIAALEALGATLVVTDGRLRYRGPKLPADDPIRAAIDEHRVELIELFSPSQPIGWSDRLGRVTLEPVPDHPGQWQEPAASAVLCIWCPEPLALGDKLGCEKHPTPPAMTTWPSEAAGAVTPGSSTRHSGGAA
jgi:hypothetical protein